MTPMQRTCLFIIGCLGTRAFLVYLSKYHKEYLPQMSLGALLISIGFFYIYLSDSRKTGVEAGGKIWWNNFRPIHGALYLAFAMLAYKRSENSYIPLAIDWIIGLLAFINYRLL